MSQNWINSLIWACGCKRPMNHDRKKQERKLSIIGIVVIVFVTLFATLSLVGCKTPQPIVQTEVKEVVVEKEVRDTIVTIAPDSASIKALLECDSAGNVLIKELTEAQGKNVKLQLSLQQASGNGVVTVECKQDSLEKVIALQNEKIQELSNNKQTETIEVKYIPEVVKWLAWIGAAALLYALGRIGLWVYKKFFLKALLSETIQKDN